MSHRAKTPTSWTRLWLIAAATEALYLGMTRWAGESLDLAQTLPFFAFWGGLVVLFAWGIRVAGLSTGKGVTLFIFLTSFAFRATLMPGGGFPSRAPDPEPSPMGHLARSASTEIATVASTWGLNVEPAVPLRILNTATDLAGLAVLPSLLRTAGMPPALSLAYGWNPLVILEGASGGHLLSLGVLFLALGFRAVQTGARTRASLAYGAAVAAGAWLWACVPLMVRFLRTHVLAAIAVGAGLWWWMGPSVSRVEWSPSMGSSLLPALIALTRVFLTRDPLYPTVACFGLWSTFVVYRAARRRLEPRELPREGLFAVGCLLMILPRVFPWYFTAVAFLSPFSANRGWLVFTLTAPLTYLAMGSGTANGWSFWLGFAQYFPPYTVLIFDWLGGRR